ncbi:methionine biosynthesis protein MetW [Rothia sp. CCM 9419]|uniref:methionine biosynthesis protein MetW n=1 Tax=Rothia sp. CCM 9419 TaxID=3402662 RepID=UPI003AD940CE
MRSGIAKLRVSQYYFDEPLFDKYEATTVRATWDFAAAESIANDGDEVLDLGCGDGRLLLHLAG